MMAFVLNEAEDLQAQVVQRHLDECQTCRERVKTLQAVLREESRATAPAASLRSLVPLFEKQGQVQRPTWSVFRRHPSLAAAAAALLALFFSAGYVQGSLVGRRAATGPETQQAQVRSLPTPPELGLFTLQTASSMHGWSTGMGDSIRDVAPPVDSL